MRDVVKFAAIPHNSRHCCIRRKTLDGFTGTKNAADMQMQCSKGRIPAFFVFCKPLCRAFLWALLANAAKIGYDNTK